MPREGVVFHEGYCVEKTAAGDAVACDSNELMARIVKGTPAEKKLIKLRDSEVASIKHIRSGGSETYIVDLVGTSERGIFKLCRMSDCNVSSEFTASLIAHKLGMSVVPVGVFRTMTIDGEDRTGYFYEFIPGKDLYQTTPPDELLAAEPNLSRVKEIRMLDYLISNWDRHVNDNRGNFIFGDDGLLYAIDHGHAFKSGSHAAPSEPYEQKTEIPLHLYQKIVALKDEKDPVFRAALSNLIGPTESNAFYAKLEHAHSRMHVKRGKVYYVPEYIT